MHGGEKTAALANVFTADEFVLLSGGPPVRGRQAIEERYANAGGALALRAPTFATADTVGYVIGAYVGTRRTRRRQIRACVEKGTRWTVVDRCGHR